MGNKSLTGNDGQNERKMLTDIKQKQKHATNRGD